MLDVDPQSPVPLYLQIARLFQRRIELGALQPGDRLPTVRDLAVQARVNRNTAARAVQLLEAEGWVATHVGKGTFVEDRAGLDDAAARMDAILERWLDEAVEQGWSPDRVVERLRELADRRSGSTAREKRHG